MKAKSQQQRGHDDPLSSLNAAVNALDLARDSVNMKPANDVFSSTITLLTTIRDCMINKVDYVELGLACADLCKVLHQGMGEGQLNQPAQSVLEAIERLTSTVTSVRKHIIKRGKRIPISQHFHAKDDEKMVSAWRQDLDGIRHALNTELGISTGVKIPEIRNEVGSSRTLACGVQHGTSENKADARNKNHAAYASAPEESPPPPARTTPRIITEIDIHRSVMKTQTIATKVERRVEELQQILTGGEGNGGGSRVTQHRSAGLDYQGIHCPTPVSGVSGETPPPPPRIFFGRDELVEEIAGLAEQFTPIALIGAGGIGKTSIALAVLHSDRIKQRFGDDRRFIRCDQFPCSLNDFLRRLSKVIGAGVENPEDLATLRPFLSSKKMFIVLDNLESIVDPQRPDAEEIYSAVEELSQFGQIFLCITSRISTIPPNCETLEITTLSTEAARNTFYRIYKHGAQCDSVNDILKQLDFHPLSITLLATVAQQNKWGVDRLAREWEGRRTGVLRTGHNKSLAAAVELSLASPMFRELGPDARELLGVVAFYPQGVDEKNLDWFFPTVPRRTDIFDGFCILSLAYRSDGSIKMLAPLRDYFSPKDPLSSSLLRATKDCYFTRLSVFPNPNKPEFNGTRWITSEDANIEHLLDVLTSIDPESEDAWNACDYLMGHLYWHKHRPVMLGPKIKRLPDAHPLKLQCLLRFSRLLQIVGRYEESKQSLVHALKLCEGRGDLHSVGGILSALSVVTPQCEEAVQLRSAALRIFLQLGDGEAVAVCYVGFASSLEEDGQFDAAEIIASHALTLLPKEGRQYLIRKCHQILGHIHFFKGNEEKAIKHLETALAMALSHNWVDGILHAHSSLAMLFVKVGRLDDANAHIEQAKQYAVDRPLCLAVSMRTQALIWHCQRRFREAESEALCAADAFGKLGWDRDTELCQALLGKIRAEIGKTS